MLKFLAPILFLLTSCASFGIKDTDSIADAEMKILHGLQTEAASNSITAAPTPNASQSSTDEHFGSNSRQ